MTEQSVSLDSAGKRLARFVLFGNYFLALCIASLCYETTLKNGLLISGIEFYIITFFLVVVYYTYAYTRDTGVRIYFNSRSQWYAANRRLIASTQIVYAIITVCLGVYLLKKYMSSFTVLTLVDWSLLFIFPVMALLYYGLIFPDSYKIQLRTVAWLKPFIIGFVCTGCIVVYPMVFSALQHHSSLHITVANTCYFVTNWLFTTSVAIMFDIKDFAADHNYHLKTFVVTKGLRYTIFFILLPLSTASFVSFIVFALLKEYSFYRIAVNLIPFLLLLYAATTLRHRRNILYYLIIIDGLLLVKALFGIAAVEFIK